MNKIYYSNRCDFNGIGVPGIRKENKHMCHIRYITLMYLIIAPWMSSRRSMQDGLKLYLQI